MPDQMTARDDRPDRGFLLNHGRRGLERLVVSGRKMPVADMGNGLRTELGHFDARGDARPAARRSTVAKFAQVGRRAPLPNRF
jgi:hypothetical protein